MIRGPLTVISLVFSEPGEPAEAGGGGGGGGGVEEDPEEALAEARLAVERVVASNTAVELTPRTPFVVVRTLLPSGRASRHSHRPLWSRSCEAARGAAAHRPCRRIW
jgi:hypothetical protein